jgi:hypothetical protein
MRTWGQLSAAGVALVAITIGLVYPASADELSSVEAREDVRHYDLAEGIDSALPGTVLPDRHDGDLRRYSVRYTEKRIRVVLKFRELTRTEPVLAIQARFRWPGGGQLNYAEALITAGEGNRSGTARLTAREPCPVEHRISYQNNRARLSFPAGCFSSPRWVQFNSMVMTMDHETDPAYLYVDDVFTVFGADEGAYESFTRRIRRS